MCRYKYLTQVPVAGLDAMVEAIRLGGKNGGCDAVVFFWDCFCGLLFF